MVWEKLAPRYAPWVSGVLLALWARYTAIGPEEPEQQVRAAVAARTHLEREATRLGVPIQLLIAGLAHRLEREAR